MTARELFIALDPWLGPALEAKFGRRDLCVLATRCAIDIANYFGIKAHALPVRAIIANAAWNSRMLALREGEIPDVLRWNAEDGSWAVGVGYGDDDEPGKWAGHLIAVADEWFADFSIQQAERPQWGLLTGTAIVGPLWPDECDWYEDVNASGTVVRYARVDNDGYKCGPDWRDRKWRRSIVGAMIRRVRDQKRAIA